MKDYNYTTIVVNKNDKEIFIKLCKKYALKQNVLFSKIMKKLRKKI